MGINNCSILKKTVKVWYERKSLYLYLICSIWMIKQIESQEWTIWRKIYKQNCFEWNKSEMQFYYKSNLKRASKYYKDKWVTLHYDV